MSNRVPTVFVLGGGSLGLQLAKKCGAVHIDHYAEVDPREVEGGVQIHVEDKQHALLFLEAAEKVYVFPEFADLLPHLKHAYLVAKGHPLCAAYSCVEDPCS
ncbi:MAG: hypothetical protein ABWK05_09535 [Pyrobaculum sp.]